MDGRDAWRQQLDAAIVTPLAADGDLLFAGLANRKIVALDAKTGAPRWEITLETTARALLATRGRLYFGGDDSVFYAYRQQAGQEWEWRYVTLTPVIGLPTADDRRLYVTFLDNTVRAFDLAIGNQRWQRPITSRPAAGPFLTDALVGVPTTSGTLILLRRTDGALAPAPASPVAAAPTTPGVAPDVPAVPPAAAPATAGGPPAAAPTQPQPPPTAPVPAAAAPATAPPAGATPALPTAANLAAVAGQKPILLGRETLVAHVVSPTASHIFLVVIAEDGSRNLVAGSVK